jgi:hypothetical protein
MIYTRGASAGTNNCAESDEAANANRKVVEGVGFESAREFRPPVFKTGLPAKESALGSHAGKSPRRIGKP